MPLIRLSKHQAIKVTTPHSTTTITPIWGARLSLRLVGTKSFNTRTVKPRGYSPVPFQILDVDQKLECAVFLQEESKNWMVELRGPRFFKIERVDIGESLSPA
ncbi:hypothetical protein pD_gene0055 [Vibrio phage 033B]|nr:hypothetical protein pD_gene0055 [Vibrio phage 033B]